MVKLMKRDVAMANYAKINETRGHPYIAILCDMLVGECALHYGLAGENQQHANLPAVFTTENTSITRECVGVIHLRVHMNGVPYV